MSSKAAQQAEDELKRQEKKQLDRIAEISLRIRNAIRASLPAPPEQFFTVMIPGKVVNYADYSEGFDDNGNMVVPILPTVTELNNAILCDDMPALGPVQLGPTGRSVARSYSAALSKLVPKGTTVGVEVADPNNLTDAEKRYEKAMNWLLQEDTLFAPDGKQRTYLQSYIYYQAVYTDHVESRLVQQNEAYQQAVSAPENNTIAKQRAAFDKWMSENGRKLQNKVEGAYKDWVVHGRKEACEYWFSVVDNDSAMARVELSKEAMRNSVVMDSDGSVMYNKVKLTPSNWAVLCRKKARKLDSADQTRSVGQITWEIQQLKKRNLMLQLMQSDPTRFKLAEPSEADSKSIDEKMKAAIAKVAEAQQKVNNAKSDDDKKAANEELGKAREERSQVEQEYYKADLDKLKAVGTKALNSLLEGSKETLAAEIQQNNDRIASLEAEREGKMKKAAGSASDIAGAQLDVPSPPPANAPQDPSDGDAEYFTSISVSVEASYEHEESTQKSQSTTAGVSLHSGGGSFGGSGSHTKSSADAEKQMANSSVKVSFECMRVDIGRNWLRPELFYDDDLQCGPNAFISPGPQRLHALLDPDSMPAIKLSEQERQDDLQRYAGFPWFPTAFLVACNVVLEVSGETSAVQSHFDTSTTTASASVGWGPISISASHSRSETHQSSTCEATASGCRITIRAPQIIGWVCQIVPETPRRSGGKVLAYIPQPKTMEGVKMAVSGNAGTAVQAGPEQKGEGTAQPAQTPPEQSAAAPAAGAPPQPTPAATT